jgi:carboxypeptidase Q
MKRLAFALLAAALVLPAQEKIDLSAINRIKTEAFDNSKVMETAFYLTDFIGSRLTGSPGYQAAGDWTKKRMEEFGLSNARFEKFDFGRGWSCSKFAAHLKEPVYAPLIGYARPWTPGTSGAVSGEAIMAVISTEAEMETFKGKLKGKMVLLDRPRELTPPTDPAAKRDSEADLAEIAKAPAPGQMFGFRRPPAGPGGRPPGMPDFAAMAALRTKLIKFLADEGVLVAVYEGDRGDGGVVRGSALGSRDPKDPVPPPAVLLAPEHYNRISRLIDHKIPVTLEFDIQARFHDETRDTFNVIGDLPGTDKKDEIVLLGGHLDSWTGGTGATDDASGCAIMMEAARILKVLDLKPRRTVRVGLWAAEEQGLLGSRAYVKDHLADRASTKLKAEHEKFSGYFNIDNGGGALRGVYLQGNDMMRPIFQSWLEPFRDYGATTITIRNTGGTDHQSFDAVGLPGFQFIQDPLDYGTRTHHTNMDVYDRLVPADMMQASAIVAAIAYHAATRDELLPRKPLPKAGQGSRGPF